MSKRFYGAAIPSDLGQDHHLNIEENNEVILYAEEINSAVYYDKNISLDGAPTKKYTNILRNDTTVDYSVVLGVKYVDLKDLNIRESSADDWILLNVNNYGKSGMPMPEDFEYDGDTLEYMVNDNNNPKMFVCNPGSEEYLLEWNGLKYFMWKYVEGVEPLVPWDDDGGWWMAYFLTSIADYDVLKCKTLKYLGDTDGWNNTDGRHWTTITRLSELATGWFDTDDNIHYEDKPMGRNLKDMRLSDISHFKGLYFTAPETFYVGMEHGDGEITNNPNIQYSINYGLTWTPWDGSQLTLDANTIIMFKGNNPQGFCKYDTDSDEVQYSHFVISTESLSPTIEAHGNIMSLIDNGACSALTLPTIGDVAGGFYGLFQDCDYLISAPELPATTLSAHCYRYMFSSCSSLTTAPKLPATTLATYCYNGMFLACGGLTTAPELPATTLASDCYSYMFSYCGGLTTAPELPATTLASYCYSYMFNSCDHLSNAPVLPATTLTSYCYYHMFSSCYQLTTAPELPATTLASDCYNGMFLACGGLTTAPELPATTLAISCYHSMFMSCSSLTSAPELPATTLSATCYASMFYGCTSLTTAPELPATTLTNCTSCYANMFYGCTSLTTAPKLPATTLVSNCYANMFLGCTSLTTAPFILPAMTLLTLCYRMMFYGCTNLTTAPILPATVLLALCYYLMFYNCKKLTKSPILPALTLTSQCYYLMFYGCSTLSNITCYATSRSASNCLYLWVSGVSSSGYFYTHPNQTASTWGRGVSAIPSNWTVGEDYIKIEPYASGVVPSVAITPSINHTLLYSLVSSGSSPSTWTTLTTSTTTTITVQNQLVLYLRGTLSAAQTTSAYTKIVITSNDSRGYVALTGNINSLWNYSSLNTALKNYCGYYLFNGSTALYTVNDDTRAHNSLKMHSNSLTTYCYANMFRGCSKLIDSPILPALSLDMNCYLLMFYNCAALTSIQKVLPATTLSTLCYALMYRGCTLILESPILPALSLVPYCYYLMFYGCTNLKKVTCYAKTNLSVQNALTIWLGNITNTSHKIFVTNPDVLPNIFPVSTSGIPDGWFVNYNNYVNFYRPGSGNYQPIITINKLSSNLTLYYRIISMVNYDDVPSGYYTYSSWSTATEGQEIKSGSAGVGLGIFLYGNLSAANSTSNYTQILASSIGLRLEGNCNSLWNTDLTTALKDYCGYRLFYLNDPNTNLTLIDNNFLPARTLSANCYREMFMNNTALTNTPKLNALTLAGNCYWGMFNGCASLTDSSFPKLPVITLANFAYTEMFKGCTGLIDLSNVILPAKDISVSAYYSMFENCTNLESAPKMLADSVGIESCRAMFRGCTSLENIEKLPALSVSDNGYYEMFKGCTSLVIPPELPAMSLSDECYYSMFWGCTSLEIAPKLPATNMAFCCYTDMFHGCTSLTYAPALPAPWLAANCYGHMFWGCTSLSQAPILPATDLLQDCYNYMFTECPVDEIICFAIPDSDTSIYMQYLFEDTATTGTGYVKSDYFPAPAGWDIVVF